MEVCTGTLKGFFVWKYNLRAKSAQLQERHIILLQGITVLGQTSGFLLLLATWHPPRDNAFFLCIRAKLLQSCPTLWQHYRLRPTRLLCPWDSPGKNTGVGCHALQGIFPTQVSNPCHLRLLFWESGSLPLAPPGKPFLSRVFCGRTLADWDYCKRRPVAAVQQFYMQSEESDVLPSVVGSLNATTPEALKHTWGQGAPW